MSSLKSQAFTASGTFDVPANVSCLWVKMIGAGASGAPRIVAYGGGVFHVVRAAGGAGGMCMGVPVPVTPETTISIVVGSGGVAAAYPWSLPSNFGNRGGDSVVQNMRVAGGYPPLWYPATDGFYSNDWIGTGGGGGAQTDVLLNQNGYIGVKCPNNFFAGSAGGGSFPNATGTGGPSVNNHPGGVGGAPIGPDSASSGGGGSSPFGVGGTGGDRTYDNSSFAGNGRAPLAGAYGCGGGGGATTQTGGYNSTQPIGGNGAGGYVMLSWVG